MSTKTNTVRYGRKSYRLEPQLIKLLTILYQNRGKVVSKEDLKSHIWDSVVVTEDSLTKAISKLRKVLDLDMSQSTIVTVNGGGYLLRQQPALASLKRHAPVLVLSSIVLFLLYILLGSGMVQWVMNLPL